MYQYMHSSCAVITASQMDTQTRRVQSKLKW